MSPYFQDTRSGRQATGRWVDTVTDGWGRTGEVPAPPIHYLPMANPHQAKSKVPVWAWVALGVVTVLTLCTLGAALLASAPEPQAGTPSETFTSMAADEAKSSTSPPTVRPTTPPTVKPSAPAPNNKVETKTSFAKLTSRQWKKIAKNPEAYEGQKYVVYGMVTQFDSVTGEDNFRAQVGGVRSTYGWDYPTNTIISAPGGLTSDLVEDDQFKAEITVVGPFEYETTLGGETTVPHLVASKVTRL
jgi:hypothetical protein